MKYDLIEPINEALGKKNDDTKKIIRLSEKQKELLTFVLMQKLPQLDGLQFVDLGNVHMGYLFNKKELDEMNNNFSDDLDILTLKNRFGDQFALYLSDEEIIIRSDDYFYLKIKESKEYHDIRSRCYHSRLYQYTYSFNFTYGNDIICISKENDWRVSIEINIYTNVVDPCNQEKIRLSFAKPINLMSDVSKYYKENGDYLEDSNGTKYNFIIEKNDFIKSWLNRSVDMTNKAHRDDEYQFRKK